MTFKTKLGEDIFKNKYASTEYETWNDKAHAVVNSVCGDFNGTKNPLMDKTERDQLAQYISDFKFVPGGRYLWYAGRDARFYNNCYLLRLEEDSREEWAGVTQRAMSCLMTGGGIGVDISKARPSGRRLVRTGGVASGPIPLLSTLNEVGRNVMQGGSRRSALYGSMNWQHEDANDFLKVKNWHDISVGGTNYAELKKADFNAPAPLDILCDGVGKKQMSDRARGLYIKGERHIFYRHIKYNYFNYLIPIVEEWELELQRVFNPYRRVK